MFTTNQETPSIPRNNQEAENNFNLKWFRVSILYHRFSNLGQAFQEDLCGKLAKDVKSKDFVRLECTFNKSSKINGKCVYSSDCCRSIVIYKTEYKDCKMCYWEIRNKKSSYASINILVKYIN